VAVRQQFLPAVLETREDPSLSMFVLGVLLEAGQHFSPGRSVEFGDVIANGIGVSCGALLGLPFRTLIAIP
jgi:VanZ family protein